MLPLSDTALAILEHGGYTYYQSVESWYGDQLLADDIPVSTATEETDRGLKVPERVTLTVPRIADGVSWSPTTVDHPLAANGQLLRVQLGIGLANNEIEWFQRGWFLIEDTDLDGDTVNVTAVGMLALIDEARLVSPYQPSGTLVSTLRGLVEPALTIVVDDDLDDRAVPAGINYDEDRLQAVLDLLTAWPADAAVDPDGYLRVVPAAAGTTPVLSLTNGAGGTVITATGTSTRDGAYNAVVAQGTAGDGGQVQGVAYATTGPQAISGPFNPLVVPYFFDSPLLTTAAQCTAAAATRLATLQRATATGFDVTMVPHPGLQVGDVVAVTTEDHTALLCTIEHLSLPWTAAGEAQTLTLRSLT